MKAGQFCWNELATTEVNKAKDFYSKVFGWEFTDLSKDEMSYTVIESKGKGLGGMWQIPSEQKDHIPPHWMSYILVTDIAIAVEKARHFGAHVIKDITQAGDMGRFAIITDPVGAHIAFWEPSQKQIRMAAKKKKTKLTKKVKTKVKAKVKTKPKKKTAARKKTKAKKKKR